MFLEHNSQEEFYRSPFGAVPTGGKVKLSLLARDFGIPHYVKLLYKVNKDKLKEQMMLYSKTIGEASIYEAELHIPQSACLIWYYFELKCDLGVFYYGNNEELLGGVGKTYDEPPKKCFQITVFDKDYKNCS